MTHIFIGDGLPFPDAGNTPEILEVGGLGVGVSRYDISPLSNSWILLPTL